MNASRRDGKASMHPENHDHHGIGNCLPEIVPRNARIRPGKARAPILMHADGSPCSEVSINGSLHGFGYDSGRGARAGSDLNGSCFVLTARPGSRSPRFHGGHGLFCPDSENA